MIAEKEPIRFWAGKTWPRFDQVFQVVALLATIVAVIAAVIQIASGPPTRTVAEIDVQRLTDLERKLDINERALSDVQARLAALSTPSDPAIVGAKLQAAEIALTTLQEELRGMEAAVGESPEKALAVPLLRKDMDALRASGSESLAAVEADLERQYDLMKWILGTFALGMLTVVITVVTASRSTSATS